MDAGHRHHVHHHDAGEVRSRPVVLDLGDGVGGLIVRTDPEMLGAEVEISPSGNDTERRHKEVLWRMLGRERATVLVYDNLLEGDYTLWVDGEPWARGVQVNGGEIAELDRRDTRAAAVA
jgi:hypothetical protein